MLHRVRLMFLTAVLVLFASFPSIAAPDHGALSPEDTALSFNVVGIVPTTINHNDLALMPCDGGSITSHECACVGECQPPAIASVSLIRAYVDPGPAIGADTARERQRV